MQTANCGMHCISLSPCRTLVACGGAEPNDCQTFKVEERRDGSLHLTPAQTLVVKNHPPSILRILPVSLFL